MTAQRNKLGNIFCDAAGPTIGLGGLYEQAPGRAIAGLDLAALLPVCRAKLAACTVPGVAACGQAIVLQCACIPYPAIKAPPFLAGDLHASRPGSRTHVKIGYVWSQDDQHGRAIYQVRIDVQAVLKLWGLMWVHVHVPTPEETQAQVAAKEAPDARPTPA